MIVCDSKVNSINDLREKGIIDDINTILDMDAFNIYNDNLTTFAKTRYGVFDSVGSKLFSTAQRETKLLKGSTYRRDNIMNVTYIVPNDAMFNAIDETVIREDVTAELNEELRDKDYGIEYGDEEPNVFNQTGLANETEFSETLNQKLQSTLQKLYPEIKVEYTNEPILPGEGLFNQRTSLRSQVYYKLKVADVLAKMGEPKETKRTRKYGEETAPERVTIRLNTKGKPNAEDNLRKTLSKKGVPNTEIDYVFKYMKANNINEISSSDLAVKLMSDYAFNIKLIDIEDKPFYYLTTNTYAKRLQGYTNDDVLGIAKPSAYSVTSIDIPAVKPNTELRAHETVTTVNSIGWFRSDVVSDPNLISAQSPIPAKILRVQELQSDHFQKARRSNKQLIKLTAIDPITSNVLGSFEMKGFKNLPVGQMFKVKGVWFKITSPYNSVTQERTVENLSNGRSIEMTGPQLFTAIRKNNLGIVDKKGLNFLNLLAEDDRWVKFFIKSILQNAAVSNIDYVRFPTEDTIVNIESEGFIRTKKDAEQANRTNLVGTANFYNNKLKDNLYKLFGKDVSSYTDGAGLSWIQIRVDQARDLNAILLQQDKSRILGQANIKALSVLIDAANQKQDTLPHEYAHHYISWFRNTPLVQDAIKKWGSEEALVQAIGEQAVTQEGEAWNWWKKFTDFILDIFKNFSNLSRQEIKNVLTDAFLQRIDLETGNTITSETILNKINQKGIISFTDPLYSSTGEVVDVYNNGNNIGKFSISNNEISTIEPIALSTYFNFTPQKLELFKELGSYYLNEGTILKSGPITEENQKVWEDLFSQGKAYKIEDQFYYTEKDLDPYVRVIDVNESGFQKSRAKEVVSILADKMARSLKINYAIITPEEAKNILANRVIGYNGEAAFFFGNTAYFVGNNFNLETLLHEFSHPLLGAIRRENPELFENLYSQLTSTDEGTELVQRIKSLYPELEDGSALFKEEVMAHALQKASVDKVNQQVASKGFLGFIQELLYHFKKLLRSIFPNKIEVSKMNEDTTIGELADMLLTKDFNYQTQLVTQEDVVMFGKFSIERADELSKNISESAIQQLINSKYNTELDLLRRAKKFRSKSKEFKVLQEAIFQKGTRELLPSVAKALRPYQTTTPDQRKNLSEEEIILDTVAAEERRIQNEKNRSLSFVTSLETTLEIVKNIKNSLTEMKAEGRFDTRSKISLMNIYQQQLEAYDLMVAEINEVFENEGITTGSVLTNLVGDIAQEIERAEKKITEIYEKSNVDFYLDITKYMQEFLEKELKSNLEPIKQYISEQEFNDLYNNAIQRQLTNDEINNLANKNVPVDIVTKFLDDYNFFKLDENRIKASLTGTAQDVRWGNRFLESYSSSNDPVVGGLAIFIQNQRTKAQQNALTKSREFRTRLPQLLDAVGFSKINVTELTNMLMAKDKIFDYDEKGNPKEFEVYSYLNEFGNGYRYELDKLRYNITEAEKGGDRKQIAAAKKELNNFINDFFWQEYLPEVYKVDEVFDDSPVGQEAWLDMRTALDEYLAFNNSIDNELERFEKYSILQAKWDAYQRLFDLNYFDGTPKVDDAEKGIFDLSKALVLRQYREAKRKYYEFIPREGSLETAYNEFVLEQEASGVKRESQQFEDAYNDWLKQNIRVVYAPEYYEAKQDALEVIRTLEDKKGKEDSTAPLFQEIMELLYGYRDEQGQPIPGSLGADRLIKINDLQQSINDIRAGQEKNDNLTAEQRDELKGYVLALKSNPESLTKEQMQRYVELTNMRKSDGLTTLEQSQLEGAYAELAEMSSKIPTEYYMTALNFYLEKQNIPPVEAKDVDNYINSPEFQDYIQADKEFSKWFAASHVTKVKYNSFGRRYTTFEKNPAYSVSIPSNTDYILKTEIVDRGTGKTITINGMPNARHSTYRVKSEYRSIPIGADRKDYIGKVINNRGENLPRPYNPNDVNSAKDDRFINKDYQALKKQGGALFELLEYMKEYHLYFQDGASQSAKLYLDMPRYGVSDVVQKFQSGEYVDRAKRLAGSTKEWLKSTWGRAQDDFNRGFGNYDPEKNVYVNTDPLNREISYVPVTGLYKINMDQVDMDLMKITGEYLMSIENQKVLIDSLPRVQSILKQLEDPRNNTKSGKISKQTGKPSSKKNASNNRLEQVRSLIDREYYGVQLSQSANQYIFLTKLMSNFSKLASFSSLALNVPADLKNRYGQLAQNVIEAAGGEFVNLKDLANSRAWAFQTMIKWAATDIYAKGVPSLTAQIIENFDAVFKTEEQLGQAVSRSLYRDLMNGSWATDFRKSAEMEAALQLFGGFMKHQKVEQRTTNGEVIYLDYLDAWETDANGIIKLKEGVDPDYGTKAIDHVYTKGETLEEIAKLYNTTVEKIKERNKIDSISELEDGTEITITKGNKFQEIKNRYHGLSRKLYGAYDAFGQPEGNKYMIYRMFFFMRKWFTPMFVNHFGMDTTEGNVGKARYDWALGTTEVGYYITAFKTLAKLLKTKGQYYNWMTAKEKAAYKKIGTQMMTIIALALVAAMVFGYDEDDEDRWEKITERSGGYINDDTFNTYGFMQNHLLALTMGVMNETSTFIPIPKMYGVQFGLDDYVKFITSTGSIFNSTGKTYAQIIQNIADYLTGDAGAYYKKDTGPYWFQQEGELKLWRNLFRVVGYSGVTGDTETLIKNIEKSSIIK